MSGGITAPSRIEPAAGGAWESVAYVRTRPIGRETALFERDGPDGLCVRALTEIATPRLSIAQTAVIRYDAALRPRGCSVETRLGARRLAIEVEIGPASAEIRSSFDGRERSVGIELTRAPLLLLDNCFVSHVLAALAADCGTPDDAPCLSLPSGEELRISRGGVPPIRLGGTEYPPPRLTLRLAPGLDEHVWIADGRVERLLIPQAQLRIECPQETTLPGGLT